MHGRGKTATAPVSDAAWRGDVRATLLPTRRCRVHLFFFRFPTWPIRAESGRFVLNRGDSCQLGLYQVKPPIQAEIKKKKNAKRTVLHFNSIYLSSQNALTQHSSLQSLALSHSLCSVSPLGSLLSVSPLSQTHSSSPHSGFLKNNPSSSQTTQNRRSGFFFSVSSLLFCSSFLSLLTFICCS